MDEPRFRRFIEEYQKMLRGLGITEDADATIKSVLAAEARHPGLAEWTEGLAGLKRLHDEDRLAYLEVHGLEHWLARDSLPYKTYLLAAIVDQVQTLDGMRILDVASGKGDMLTAIAKEWSVAEAVGFEPSRKHRDFAEKLALKYKARNIRFVDGRIIRLPFADRYFDYAFSTLAMHWSEHKVSWLCEMARVLKVGGHFLLNYSAMSPHGRFDPEEVVRVLAKRGVEIRAIDVYRDLFNGGFVTMVGRQTGSFVRLRKIPMQVIGS